MSDKQIITKDVDARGCKFFRNGICVSPINSKCKLCVEISEKMCYYKQLKRTEQELQEAMDNYVQLDLQRVKEYNELVDLYKAKEQECEELKKAIDGLLKIQYQLADSCNKYAQTLIGIKEIALGVRNYLACPSPRDVRYEMDIILQKISECEENNDMENN